MSDRKLIILGIVAVLMVIWAVVQSRISSRPRTQPDAPAYLIQGLDTAQIGGIVLGVGEKAVTLKRQGRSFVVVSSDNYPAKVGEINNLITSCLDIRAGELYTDDAANHKDLEVTEEDARTVIKFLRPDSSLLTGVVVGKAKEQASAGSVEPGQATYVRLLPGDKVYVVPTVPWFRNRAIDYIERALISVKRENIESVTVRSPDDEYTLKPAEDGKAIVLENIPAGKKLKGTDGETVFTSLTNLGLEDVKKKSGELTFDRQYVCRLKDSTVYTLMLAQKADKTYVNCKAVFTGERPDLETTAGSEEELKEKEAKLLAWEGAAKFSAKHQAWVYEIPDWKAKNMTKKLSDLIEDEEKPKEAEKPEDPNAIKVSDPNAIMPEL
ncbi:MAG: DUF4340 domain-containing protein [Planctomycetota bacterium]|jgi:hypothetical protein